MSIVAVTGTTRGLGLQLIKQIVSSSSVSHVFATGRSPSPSSALKDLISSTNNKITYVPLDVDSPSSIATTVQTITSHLNGKGIDILINNAGIQVYEPEGVTSMTGLEQTLHTNVIGVYRVSSAFVPLLRQGSLKRIVNISTTLGSIAMIETFETSPVPSYKVSKAALNMLTAQYALYLGKEGFTVFCVSPGWLKTDLGKEIADLEPEVGAKAVWDAVEGATEKDNGSFKNIYVEGNETYDGKNAPW